MKKKKSFFSRFYVAICLIFLYLPIVVTMIFSFNSVFDGIRRFINAHDKALREDALRNNKTLPGGGAIKTVTQAEFDNMSYTEMLAFKRDNPEQFAEFTK